MTIMIQYYDTITQFCCNMQDIEMAWNIFLELSNTGVCFLVKQS